MIIAKALNKRKNAKGFTLVELLVVMAIIAILVTLIIYAINAARMQSRNTTRRNIANSTKAALEGYFSTKKNYPAKTTPVEVNALYTSTISGTTTTPSDLESYAPGMNSTNSKDPLGEARICYYSPGTSVYTLYVIPEPEPDPATTCQSTVPTNAEDFSVKK